jgi:hypothetical protein
LKGLAQESKFWLRDKLGKGASLIQQSAELRLFLLTNYPAKAIV